MFFAEELPLAIIIGGAVGGVVVIFIIVIVCVVYHKCRHSDNGMYSTAKEHNMTAVTLFSGFQKLVVRYKLKHVKIKMQFIQFFLA